MLVLPLHVQALALPFTVQRLLKSPKAA